MDGLPTAHDIAKLGQECAKLTTYLPKSYKAISRELVQTVFEKVIEDSSIPYADRIALASNIDRIVKHYKNQQDILEKANKYLTKENPNLEQTINEDWFDLFLEECKTTSDEQMQEIWSKLLAEECENPNSIRKDLLFSIKIMDPTVAKCFEKINNMIFTMMVFTDDALIDSDELIYIDMGQIKPFLSVPELAELEDKGLISNSSDRYTLHFNPPIDKIIIAYQGLQLTFTSTEKMYKLFCGTSILTHNGMRLSKIIQKNTLANKDYYIHEIQSWLEEQGFDLM